MDQKLTPKQEKFCRIYVETGNASEAYRKSYNVENMSPGMIGTEACKKLNLPNISLRVELLKKEHADRHVITVDLLTDQYMQAWNVAKKGKNAQGMVSATTGLGKLHGLIIEKQKIDIPMLDTHYTLELVCPPNYEDKDRAEVSRSYGNGNGNEHH